MTENEMDTEELLSKLKRDPFDIMQYLSVHQQVDIKKSEIYTDFLLSFLIKRRNGIGKIDQLVLDTNKVDLSLKSFIEKQNATKYGYAETVKQTDKYIRLKITGRGISHFKYISIKYRTKSPTFIKRISLYVLKLIRKFWSFVFVSANNRIKIIIESGIIKLIVFIITVIGLLIKWEEIKAFIHALTEK
jgi:hypothetical protein